MKTWKLNSSGYRVEYNPQEALGEKQGSDAWSCSAQFSTFEFNLRKENQFIEKKTGLALWETHVYLDHRHMEESHNSSGVFDVARKARKCTPILLKKRSIYIEKVYFTTFLILQRNNKRENRNLFYHFKIIKIIYLKYLYFKSIFYNFVSYKICVANCKNWNWEQN